MLFTKIGIFGNYMRLQLKFKNIIDSPMCRVYLCQQQHYEGPVLESIDIDTDCQNSDCQLKIEHWDKRPQDTVV